jgi:hypothetical protein
VYTPFVIVTAFADQEPIKPRRKTQAKPAPIIGAYTNRYQQAYPDTTIKSQTWFSSAIVINCKTLFNSEPLIKICHDEKKPPDLPDYTDSSGELYPREAISHGRSMEISL